MSSFVRSLIVGLGSCCGLGMALAALLGSWSLAPSLDRSAPQRAFPQALCALAIGDHLAFEVHAESRYRLNPAALLGGAAPDVGSTSTKVLVGTMLWRVVERLDGEATIAATLRDATITVDGVDATPDALGRPIVFRMTDHCIIDEFGDEFSGGDPDDALARQELQLVLQLAEIDVPDASATAWTTAQIDTVGAYDASYRRDASVIHRTRQAYRSVHTPPGHEVDLRASILQSRAEATIADSGDYFASVDVDEHVRLSTEHALFVDAETTLHLTRIDSLDEAWADGIALAGLVWHSSDRLPQTADGTDRLVADVQGQSLSEVMDQLTDFVVGSEEPDHHAALSVLVSYLQASPTHPEELIDFLRDETSLGERVRSVAFLALELAGGPATHTALLEAMSDRTLIANDRLRAVVAYRDVRDADATFIDNLSDILGASRRSGDRDIESAALLGLGALAKHPRIGATERQRIRDRLRDELNLATPMDRQIDALGAIGNAQATELGDDVTRFTESSNAFVRAASYDTLASIGASPPDSELLDLLLGDPSLEVQRVVGRELLRNADTLAEPLVTEIAASLGVDQTEGQRRTLITALGANVDRVPAAAVALQRHFTIERDRELLRLIGRYLPVMQP